MKKISTIITILFFLSSGLMAQVGEIKGIVKDKVSGEPLPGATAHIKVGGVLIGVATDANGKYTIKPVQAGVHTVHIEFFGYQKMAVKGVPVSSDRISYVNMDMEKTAIQMGDFEVVAERVVVHDVPLIDPDEPHVKMLTAKDIKNDPNIHNPIQIVASIPGVTLAPNGKDVYIRGSRPASTQFITDGVKSITGKIGIPGQAIGSIKVYTGGVPARYGDVSGGVIVVETKSYFDLAQQYK